MDRIISLTKRRGFIYQTSEIYGGLANGYDYGPLGVELLRNIKELWWKKFVHERNDMVGLDTQIILHPKTWEASGHVGNFADAVVEDTVTHKRYRADHLVEKWIQGKEEFHDVVVEEMTIEELSEFIKKNNIKSPDGNTVSESKKFDLLMKTHLGSLEGEQDTVYLRGETAQGIFTNFKNVLDSTRIKLPFGIGQIGKSFRNEITLGQYIFRTFEFEQGEIEYFFDPEKEDWKQLFKTWQNAMWNFVVQDLGIQEKNLRWRRHTDTERSHYSKDTYDLDYQFPFGWKELWGIAYRTDYDLKQQMKGSSVDLRYTDPYTQKKIIPHVIEPAVGMNRLVFMTLCDSYCEENDRVVLKIKPMLAPYTAAVFPLVSNKQELITYAEKIFNQLSAQYHTYWDDRGNIGKRYRYQDEIGTPLCITVDYESLETHTVTIRDRDTMKQSRIAVKDVVSYIANIIKK
ncbi:MAG: Glycine-tRNA ligase [Candidatus Roizmanbacteria bacterium GW2011_GWA2_37_7]|uniref:glycine--tRNA ligase n=1 Tax=Candidatus Roizmanbacteria bacterium GW2011_GWA2_37_7 TaxID=1618481 RepID=A0A0G0JNA2_9BACT|nr:MAG: Glycine-tRNA ligase [Candidatus Roizmanbacteria bacterium GW2011_GWA2_37_7]